MNSITYHIRNLPTDDDRTESVRNELIRLVMDPSYSSGLSSYVLSLLLAFLLRHELPAILVTTWLGVMTLILLTRLAAGWCYKKKKPSTSLNNEPCVRAYVIATGINGLFWGAGAYFLFPSASPIHQMALILIIAGLSAGAVPILSPHVNLYIFYIWSALAPLTVRFFMIGGEVYFILSFAIILYAGVLARSAQKMNASLKSAHDLRFYNESLNNSLLAAHAEVEAAGQAKNEFLANMSHEIRTPMNGILGTLEILQKSTLDVSQKELLEMAHNSAESLLSLLNDILDFSKIEAGKLELESIPFDLRQVINDIIQLLSKQSSQKSLTIRAEIDENLPDLLVGDPTRIRQVLVNLLSNAIKFTDEGEILIRTSILDRDDDKVYVKLEVIDSGIGVDLTIQQELFHSFTQADGSMSRKYGGTGLGLAIVRQLLELMHGEFGLESAIGKGSNFWCELSFAIAGPNHQPTKTTISEAVEAGHALSGNILLVEDNKVNQVVAGKMLEGMGLEHVLATNGEEAIQQIQSKNFDAILMDCQMPIMDGFEATRGIRKWEKAQKRKPTPIIAMTAHAMVGYQERCLAAGMDDYLAKPVKAAMMKKLLQRWLRHSGHDDVSQQINAQPTGDAQKK